MLIAAESWLYPLRRKGRAQHWPRDGVARLGQLPHALTKDAAAIAAKEDVSGRFPS